MDMKKILQAIDNVQSKPVEGSNDIKRSLQILEEGANPNKVSLPVQMVMNHYQTAAPAPKESLLKKYIAESEADFRDQEAIKQQRIAMYSRKIANRVLVKESVQNANNFSQADTEKKIAVLNKQLEEIKYAHKQAQEITREIKYDDVPSSIISRIRTLAQSVSVDPRELESAEDYVFDAIRNLESSIYGLDDVFGELARDVEMQADELQGQIDDFHWEQKYGRDELNESADLNPKDTVKLDIPLLIRLLEYAREDAKTDMDLHNVTEMLIQLSQQGHTLTMDQYDQIVGDQKMLPNPTNEGQHDPCWKGYRQLGTRRKGGRKVPHCVPKR